MFTNLFSRFVEVQTSRDEFVTLFSSRDELLPSMCDAVGDVANRLRVVVVVPQQRLGPLPNVNGTCVRFLQSVQ
jgi:hypothetical protein